MNGERGACGGDELILINKSETPYDAQANILIQGSIGEVLDVATR